MPVIFIDASSVGSGSGITGSGSSGQVSVFSGASAIAGYPGLTYDPTTGLSLLGSLTVSGDEIQIGPIPDPSTTLTATLVVSPGNIDTATFTYAVSFVTNSASETLPSADSNSVTITNNAVAGQINLTNIPISTNPQVTARNIYRKDDVFGVYELATTINDNTTTTFLDNLSNASLPWATPSATNTTGRFSVSSVTDFYDTTTFHNTTHFNSTTRFEFTGNSAIIDGGSNQLDFPFLNLVPDSNAGQTFGLRILPGGVDFSPNLVEIHDRHTSLNTLVNKIDQYGHLVSGDNVLGVTATANIYISGLQTNSTYGLRIVQGVRARFDDYIELTKSNTSITGAKYQFGIDVADVLRLNVPSGTGINFSVNAVDILSSRAVSPLTITQTAMSGNGTLSLFTATAGAHTNLTLSTEKSDVVFDLGRTVQWATGALTTQRAFRIVAPTYAFVGASILSDAATFAITAAPTAGPNATITRSMALWVQAGTSRFDGRIVGFSVAVTAANDLTLGAGNQNVVSGNTQITAILTAGWMAGSIVSLIFSGTPTVKHNTAGGAGTAKIFLAGSVDFVAAANSVLTLEYDGTQWQEKSRKVA